MPKLTQNVLYKGRILPAGKEISATAAKQFGDHVLEASPKKAKTDQSESDKTEE